MPSSPGGRVGAPGPASPPHARRASVPAAQTTRNRSVRISQIAAPTGQARLIALPVFPGEAMGYDGAV